MILSQAPRGSLVYFECGCSGRVLATFMSPSVVVIAVYDDALCATIASPHKRCELSMAQRRGYDNQDASTLFWLSGGIHIVFDPLADALDKRFS